MRASFILAMTALALVGCRSSSTDPFCRAHNAADITPTRQAYGAMTPSERRASLARLDEAARRCGWEP